MIVVWLCELEIELEGVILPKIRRKPAVFEPVIEYPEATTCYEFVRNLVRETESRRKIGFLRVAQSLSVCVAYFQRYPICTK